MRLNGLRKITGSQCWQIALLESTGSNAGKQLLWNQSWPTSQPPNTLCTLEVRPTSGGLQAVWCVPRIWDRKISKGFLTQMKYIPRQWENLQVELLASWESSLWNCGDGKLPESWSEINVLISPQRGKKVESGTNDRWTSYWCWQRTVDCRIQVMRWSVFKRKWWPLRIRQGSVGANHARLSWLPVLIELSEEYVGKFCRRGT